MTLRNRTYLPRTGRFASRADGQVVMSGPGVGTGCGPSSLRNSIHRRLTSCQMTCWSLKNASSRPSSRSWAGVVTRSSPSHRGSAAAGMAGIPRTTVDAAVRARAVTSATKARDRNRCPAGISPVHVRGHQVPEVEKCLTERKTHLGPPSQGIRARRDAHAATAPLAGESSCCEAAAAVVSVATREGAPARMSDYGCRKMRASAVGRAHLPVPASRR